MVMSSLRDKFQTVNLLCCNRLIVEYYQETGGVVTRKFSLLPSASLIQWINTWRIWLLAHGAVQLTFADNSFSDIQFYFLHYLQHVVRPYRRDL